MPNQQGKKLLQQYVTSDTVALLINFCHGLSRSQQNVMK